MVREIFVNLPVKDLKRSMEFFKGLGFTFNMDFTNEDGACMVMGGNIYAMLLTEKFFGTFTDKPVADPAKTTGAIVCIAIESRKAVDDMVKKALATGGKPSKPAVDHGFMYQHGFQDPDGHIWEVVHLNKN